MLIPFTSASLFASALPVLTDHNIASNALSEYAHGKHDQASSTSVRLHGRDDDLSRRALLGPSGISGLMDDIKGAAFTHISEPLYKTWQPTTEPGFFDRKMLRAKLRINERAKSTWNASKKPVVTASTAVKDAVNVATSATYQGVKNGLVYVADTSKKMGDKGATFFRQTGSALKKPFVDLKAWLNKGPKFSDETKFTPSGGNKIPRRPAGEPRIDWNRPMHIVPFNG